MKTLPFREWTIAYTRQGQGPTVLFLHNGGTSHHIWMDVAERLSSSYDTIAIDLLGYGQSSKPGHSYTMDVYVDMVRTVLDTLDIPKAHLVGNCMGSAISLHVAKTYPERVQTLSLVNPLTEGTFKKGWLAGVLKARQLSPKMIGGAYRKLSAIRLPRWTAGSSLSFQLGRKGRARGIHRDPALKDLHASDGQLRSMLEVLADIESYAAIDQPDFVEQIPHPILTLWGESNRVLSARAGKKLNTTLAPQQQHQLSGCGHLVMMEAPEDVAAHLSTFLQEHPMHAEVAHAL